MMVDAHDVTKRRLLVIIAIALFAVSFVVRFILSDYPKGIGVLPDEIRYLNLASSLFNQGELLQRGGYTSFQKILYPLSLFPAFLADDPLVRVRLISVLNCLYLSSAVFPALLLARRLFNGTIPIVICLVFTVIMPDMAYSMTFLSECVYLPLVLWLVWLSLKALMQAGRKGIALSAVTGALCYACYLAKEVALGFFMAYALMLIVRLARSDKGERRDLALSLAAFIVGFVVPFALLKLTLFAGMLNSYNQADPSILLDPYTLLFGLYAFASDAAHFLIAFMFFPLVIPALTWRRLSDYERNLYLFCILSFLFILIAVVYTISMREDLGHVGVRPHVRYVAPLFLPLLFLTIKQLQRKDGVSIAGSSLTLSVVIALTIVMGALSVVFLGTGDYSQGFDSAQFHVVRMADEAVADLDEDLDADADDVSEEEEEDDIYHGETLEINGVIWLLKLVFCMYLAFGFWAYLSSRHRWPAYALLGFIALVMLANNVGMYLYNSSVYRITMEDAREFALVDAFVDEVDPGEQVLIVCDEGSSHFNNLMDVYVDNDLLNCSYIKTDQFEDALSEGGDQSAILLASDSTMGDNVFKANGRTNSIEAGISYIIMSAENDKASLDGTIARDVTPDGFENVIVYQIVPGESIAYAKRQGRASRAG